MTTEARAVRAEVGGATLVFGRLALIRLRRHPSRSAAMLLGLVLAVALAASVALVQAVAADLGVVRAVQGAGADGLLMITQDDVGDQASFGHFVVSTRRHVHDVAGDSFGPAAAYLATGTLNVDTLDGRPPTSAQRQAGTALSTYPDLAPHVTVVAGRLPSGSVGADVAAAVTEHDARGLGLHLGDRECVVDDQGGGFCARVVGIVRPAPGSSAWWGPEQAPDASLLVDQPAYFRLIKRVPEARSFAHVAFRPDADAFGRSSPATSIDRIAALRADYSVLSQNTQIATGLDSRLAAYQARAQTAQFALLLVLAEILLVALLYLAFAARHVLDQQREELAAWRGRGWRRRSVWGLLVLEFAVLACASVPLGVALGAAAALAVLRISFGTFPTQVVLGAAGALWPAALVAAALGLGVLGWRAAGASRVPLVDARRLASRPPLRPWWRWRHLDLGLGALGLLLLLRTPVLGEGTAGLDPSTLALPGIGLVLLALVSLRLLPLVARLAGRVERGLALSLASWQLGRRPLQHSLLALLLLVTVALGVFAGTYVTTQRRNADDRAAYQAGADVRARFGDDVNVPPVARTLSGLHGVEDAASVYRGTGRLGRLASVAPTVLGVDPVAFGRVAWSRGGLDDPSLHSSLARLVDPGDDAVRLPGRPARIGAWVEGGGVDASLAAVVVDATGRSDTLTLGRLRYSGWRYLDAPVAAGLRAPLYLRELDVRAASTGAGHTATVALRDLSVTLPGSRTPHVVAGFAGTGGTGWWATQPGTGLSRGRLKATAGVLFHGRPATVLPVGAGGETVIRPVPRGAVPALASAATLEHTGVPAGVPFPLTIGAAQVPVVVVGRVDYVPTLYPGQEDFLVLDLHGLLAHLGYGGEPHAWPNELWANVAPTADAADRAALQRSPSVAQVLDRRDAQRAAASDPLTDQLEANLSIGFATALVLAIAAFGLHFLAAAAGRRGEYAILEANGLAPRTIRRSLVAEQLTVLAFGVLVGLALGLLVAWIVLPALHLETGPAATIPPTVVTVRWGLLGGALAAIAALATGAGLAAGRAARRFSLVEELRTL